MTGNMCLYPKFVLNKKYIPNKKNGGFAPPISDSRVLYTPVGCGKCMECLKRKSRDWQVRLYEEYKRHTNCHFVTLTFSDESLDSLSAEIKYQIASTKFEENEICTLAIRRFLNLWRKHRGHSPKHWLITELGHENTERIHIHGIIWCNDLTDIPWFWKYGIVHVGYSMNRKVINYCVKYVTKLNTKYPGYIPKIHTSPGIGKSYINSVSSKINKYDNTNTREYYQTEQGHRINLPTYYKNKLYTEEQKEQLWINLLNKNTRYICGEKIDISKDEKMYYSKLKYYQTKNKILGYGDDSTNFDIWEYKKARRKLKRLLSGKFKH